METFIFFIVVAVVGLLLPHFLSETEQGTESIE